MDKEELKAVGKGQGLIGRQKLVKGTDAKDVEVILHYADHFRHGKLRNEDLKKEHIFSLDALSMDLHDASLRPVKGSNRGEQSTGAQFYMA